MNINDLSTQLLFTTVPVWTEYVDGSRGSGTGFIYNVPVPSAPNQSIPLLVTNLHVVDKAKRALVEFVERVDSGPAPDRRVRVELDSASNQMKKSISLDIAIFPLGPAINEMGQKGRPPFFRSVTPELIPSESAESDLAAMEEIVFIGYPSGLRDEKSASPLIRRGITASPVWNDFGGEPAFMIDAGVFPGSSGSPVFILNQGAYPTKDALVVGSRILFLGVLTQTIVRSSKTGDTYLGLGKVIKSRAVDSFIKDAVSPLLKETT